MDEGLKLLLQQINNNISELRSDHNLQVENINVKIDARINELRHSFDLLSIQISEIQKDYITAADIKSIKNMMVTKEACKNNIHSQSIKKEEMSIKKLALIIGCISSAATGFTLAAVQIAEIITK